MPELIDKLGDSITWINLRVKLATMLLEQANAGDEVASGLLTFLAEHWKTGTVPLANIIAEKDAEISRLERRIKGMQFRGYAVDVEGES